MKPLSPDDFLSQAELRRFFKMCLAARDRAILLVAYRHGLRPSEVGLLKVADVDLRARTLYCRRIRGTGSGPQFLGPDEIRELRPLVRGRSPASPLFVSRKSGPISRKRLDAIMKTCGEAAGIPPHKRHFQVLRYSLAVHVVQAGADPALAESLLGLRSPETRRIRLRDLARILRSERIVSM